MPGYLNVEAIQNAAELVNTTLQSKGYLSEPLLFPTVDWAALTADQPHAEALEQLQTHETLYNNDKNVINIIYSLSQSLDRHNAQHQTFNRTLQQKETTIADLQRRLEAAESRASAAEDKLARATHGERAALADQVRQLGHSNRVHTQEVARLRSWNAELQGKYDVEMRRKDARLAELKDKLLDTRRLSTTITYGRPAEGAGAAAGGVDTNAALVHHGRAVSSHGAAAVLDTRGAAAQAVAAREYDGIATQLAELIENLIAENGKYARFVQELTAYVARLNAALVPGARDAAAVANPSDFVDMGRVAAGAAADIEPFENVSRPLLSAVYSHYHGLTAVVAALAAADGGESRATIDQLTEENKMLSKNWQEAMAALEEWKSYKR